MPNCKSFSFNLSSQNSLKPVSVIVTINSTLLAAYTSQWEASILIMWPLRANERVQCYFVNSAHRTPQWGWGQHCSVLTLVYNNLRPVTNNELYLPHRKGIQMFKCTVPNIIDQNMWLLYIKFFDVWNLSFDNVKHIYPKLISLKCL